MRLRMIDVEDIKGMLPKKYIKEIYKDKIVIKDMEEYCLMMIKNNNNITITISDYSGNMDYVLTDDFDDLKI